MELKQQKKKWNVGALRVRVCVCVLQSEVNGARASIMLYSKCLIGGCLGIYTRAREPEWGGEVEKLRRVGHGKEV